jgi:TrmH family RNA methyltransferase
MHMSGRSLAYSEIVFAEENPEIFDSLLHPLAILIRQVLTRAGRQDLNLMVIDDEENIFQALEGGIEIHSVYYSGGETISAKLVRKLPAGVTIHEVARRTCKKLFESDRVSRIFAIAHLPEPVNLDSLLELRGDIVALEDLSISGNIGAIVRTSLAFNAGGIVLLNTERIDVYDRRLIRASRGHIFSLPVVTATVEEFIHFCKRNHLRILVMSARAGSPVYRAAAIPERLVIVFGSEKNGSSKMPIDVAALHVQIATHAKVESLNVSTAAGIMLYNRAWFNAPRTGK